MASLWFKWNIKAKRACSVPSNCRPWCSDDDEGDGRSVFGRGSDGGGHYSACLFQRQSALGGVSVACVACVCVCGVLTCVVACVWRVCVSCVCVVCVCVCERERVCVCVSERVCVVCVCRRGRECVCASRQRERESRRQNRKNEIKRLFSDCRALYDVHVYVSLRSFLPLLCIVCS